MASPRYYCIMPLHINQLRESTMKFIDSQGHTVTLHLNKNSTDIAHVLIIPKYDDQYLLTRHRLRGVEFPGGKIEPGETLEEAAGRELFEETGGVIDTYEYAGFYRVENQPDIVKGVVFAQVSRVEAKDDYLETDGPVHVRTLDWVDEKDKSPLLNDACIQYLYEMSLSHEFFKG